MTAAELLARTEPAGGPHFERWGLRRALFTADFCRRHLPAGSRALDVSSGPHVALAVAHATPGVRWSHTDHDAGGCAFTDRATGEVVFEYAPFAYPIGPDSPPPPGGPWDAVTLWEVVEHLDFNPALHFAALNRALRPGGLLLLSTPNVGGLTPQYHAARGGRPFQTAFFPRAHWLHTREYGTHELRGLLAWAGFEPVACETADLYAGDLRGWRKFARKSCLALAGLLTLDPAAARHALRHSGSTQFWAARKTSDPGPPEKMPPA